MCWWLPPHSSATACGKPELRKANLPATVVSYQELAQEQQLGGEQDVLKVPADTYRFVLVDEAHAYRNSDTSWYSALSRLMGGPEKNLALLTATPVNNTLWDLHSLFLLFGRHDAAFASEPLGITSLQEFFREAGAGRARGGRQQPDAPGPSPAHLFPLLDALTVRRDRAFIRDHLQRCTVHGRHRGALPPSRSCTNAATTSMRRTRAWRVRSPTGSSLPPDLTRRCRSARSRWRSTSPRFIGTSQEAEAARQEALAHLMRSLLLKRFESCWYAALQTVRRMRRKAAARIRYLEVADGGEPLPGDEENLDEIEAAAVELTEESGDWAEPERFRPDLLTDLQRDVGVLDELVDQIAALYGQPDPKLEALREVMATTDSQKVVVFTSFRRHRRVPAASVRA